MLALPLPWTHSLIGVLLLLTLDAAAREVATLTLAEGQSTIISGARGYLPAVGMQLQQCNIVHTSGNGLVQVEIADQGMIQVGPETRLVADLPSAGSAIGPHFLLSGWAKVTVPKREAGAPQRINTPLFDVVIDSGVVLLHVADDGAQAFVESGEATVLEASGRSLAKLGVRAGSTYSRKSAGTKGEVVNRADPKLVSGMPRAFRDTLPPRLPQIKVASVVPKPATEYDYKDVETWLQSDPDVRQCLVAVMVRGAQEELKRLGIDVGPIDGILGPQTQAALRTFQQKQGLAQTGQLDQETLKALNVAEGR